MNKMIEYVLWIIAFIALYLTIVWLNLLHLSEKSKEQKTNKYPAVSIAVPAYNEGKSIEKTLKSIIQLDYPKNKIEIIAVNDGSTDNTKEVVERFVKENKRFNIKVINKKNSGKAAALNSALDACTGELFACVDADTFVDRDSLRNTIYRFSKKRTGAVISTIKVANTKNVYGRVQRMEYLMAVFMRKLMTITKTLHTTPGALSVYRTKLIKKLGGFDEENITEDFEIALRLKYYGYDVELEPKSVVYTKVPDRLSSLWRQRIRWSRGFVHNHIKYKSMILNKKHGLMGQFQIPLNIIAPVLLISSIGIILYFTITKLYELVIRSILIHDYFKIQITSLPTMKEVILGQNTQIMFPIILGSIIGILLFYMAHKTSQEKIKNPGSIIAYFLLMPYFIASYWVSALADEVTKKKRRW